MKKIIGIGVVVVISMIVFLPFCLPQSPLGLMHREEVSVL